MLAVLHSVHDCLCPSEVLQFRYNSWNCRPSALFDSCVNIL